MKHKTELPEGLTQTGEQNWEYRKNGRLLEFGFFHNMFGYYDGPENPTARVHEGSGGKFSKADFLQKKLTQQQYPELYPYLEKLVKEHLS